MTFRTVPRRIWPSASSSIIFCFASSFSRSRILRREGGIEHSFARVEAVDGEVVFFADLGLGLELGHGDEALGFSAEIDDGVVGGDGENSAAFELAAGFGGRCRGPLLV